MTIFPTSTDTDMMETAKVSDMDSPQSVAQASIEGLLNKKIEVILGGQQQKKMIRTNLEEPLKIDKKVKKKFEAMRERAEHHSSM